MKQQTGCLPTTPAPEGRHHLCRGRQAPGRKKDKSSILSHRWLSPPAVPVSALRAWNKMRATSVAATHLMFTRNTSPGGAALPLAGADRPRGGRRIRVPSYPTSVCVGPPGLEQVARNLCGSNKPDVYPQYQPRRGGTTPCRGRQAPGRKKNKSSILSHQCLCRPSGPEVQCERRCIRNEWETKNISHFISVSTGGTPVLKEKTDTS